MPGSLQERELDMEAMTLDPQICRQCRGLCCQGHPGVYVDPERFWAIHFDGEVLTPAELGLRLPFVGLELKEMSGVPVPAPRKAPWGCVFLGQDGCRLSSEERPCQCLALEPHLDTLLDGEIRCNMPPGFGYGAVRQRWADYWADTAESSCRAEG